MKVMGNGSQQGYSEDQKWIQRASTEYLTGV